MTDYNLAYLYDEESRTEAGRYIKDYRRKEPLRVLEIKNGIILPRVPADRNHSYTWMGFGGVLDEKDHYVELSGIKHIFENGCVFGGSYEFDRTNVINIDEDVIYIGPLFNHWGHYLYEFITRLWYCCQNETGKIAYCGWGFDENGLRGSYKRFFELLQIDTEKLLDIRKPARFRKVIIPEQCYLRNQYYTQEYRDMIAYAYSNINCKNLKPADKIYFTRASFIKHSGWYREYGENVIQKTFEKNGFTVFDPAVLSLDEQIFYMHNCNIIAVIGSSTAADTVFMRDHTDRIYIKKGFYMDTDLSQLDQMTNARHVTVLDCWLKPYKRFKANHSKGPHLIGAAEPFLRYLQENHLKALNRHTYIRSKYRTYAWFAAATVRNTLFSIFYPIYYNTLRKLVRKNIRK